MEELHTIKVWEICPKLVQLVLESHHALMLHAAGHPFDHTLQVGQVAGLIAEDADTLRLAGAAGLCHNADRLLQRHADAEKVFDAESHVGAKTVAEKDSAALATKWLEGSGEFTPDEIERIVSAVLQHNRPNAEDDDDVLIALQDADRIVCSMADTVMHTAQFWSRLPAIDPQWLTHDPDAHSYKNPKSVLKNLTCRYDWIDPASKFCVRLPKAKVLMERHIAFIRSYCEEIEKQRTAIGLWPYTPPFL
ncbi:MAG: HD domain-containing protein [bacterium]|nr:HD domain-containing protein [bacterium]